MTPTPLVTIGPGFPLLPTATSAVDRGTRVGVQLFGDEVLDGAVPPFVDAGIGHVRLPVQWRYIEPLDKAPSEFLWHGLDRVIPTLNEAGLSPVAVLYTRPDWASSSSCGPIDLTPLSRYTNYISELVERYDGDGFKDAPGSPIIRYWEIENEQDFNGDPMINFGASDYGSCFGGDDYQAYSDQLRAAYLAIKAADSQSTVIFGGLSFELFYNRPGFGYGGPFDFEFTKNVLEDLHSRYGTEPAWPFFDWMGMHVYNDFRNNWDGTATYDREMHAKLRIFRDTQLHSFGKFDLRGVPIAITEASVSSYPSDQWTQRSEALQAHYPGRLMARSVAQNVPLLLWFLGRDRLTGPCDDIYAWQGFGLIKSSAVAEEAAKCEENPLPADYGSDVHNAPKPALQALATANENLQGYVLDTQFGSSITGNANIEAYRFEKPSTGEQVLVIFTDNGHRIGRRSSLEVNTTMSINSSVLPTWTGRVIVTDHLGNQAIRTGSSIKLNIGQAPIYVRVD